MSDDMQCLDGRPPRVVALFRWEESADRTRLWMRAEHWAGLHLLVAASAHGLRIVELRASRTDAQDAPAWLIQNDPRAYLAQEIQAMVSQHGEAYWFEELVLGDAAGCEIRIWEESETTVSSPVAEEVAAYLNRALTALDLEESPASAVRGNPEHYVVVDSSSRAAAVYATFEEWAVSPLRSEFDG